MIRSTFSGFTTAQLAMAASQRALDVSGQNIANINTLGYTRQRLDIASLNTRGAQFYNADSSARIGYGVNITGISQLRDPFLDAQYRSQIAKLGTTDAHNAAFEQLAPVFDEAATEGVRAALSSLTSALDELSKNVGSQEFDSMVRSNSQILLNLFHESATKLSDLREEMTQGFQDNDVKDVNELLENIANLNTTIKNSQILGNPALELQDQRNNLIDELASYLPITTQYRKEEIGPGQFVEVLDISFKAQDGTTYTLISDDEYGKFNADITEQPVRLELTDCDGRSYVDITDQLTGGTLKGTLDILNKSGDFDNTDVKGLGYYEKALDSLVNKFATVLNDLNRAPVVDADGVVQKDADGNIIYEDRPLFETSDGSDTFTAGNIQIAKGWANGSYGITASVTPDADGKIGSTANDNILRILDALKAEQDFSYDNGNGTVTFYKGSFYDCFANIENTLAIDTKSTATFLQNQISVLNQTSNSRDGISGVSLDEEGMNLMHYNQSYSAAARFMTTIDEALDTLINNTGVVGR